MSALIGLAGRKQSGKSALADWLGREHRFTTLAFADPIKRAIDDIVADVLTNSDPDSVKPIIEGDKEWIIPQLGVSLRQLYQTLGTEWGRKLIHPDLWIMATMPFVDRMLKCGSKIVIPDVRFPNEIDAIRKRGGAVIWIERGEIDLSDDHISERSISMRDTDHVITNNFGDVESFCRTGAEYVLSILEEGGERP